MSQRAGGAEFTNVLSDLTLQQLRCFVEVADQKQFTAAAAALEIAQPSLSSQISRLEQTLGVILFNRDHRPVTLTGAGAELLPLARRVLVSAVDVMHGVDDVEGLKRGRVSIGATPSLAATLLPQVLAGFHAKYPGVAVSVTERGSNDLAAELAEGTLDLALVIMPLKRPGLVGEALATEELVVLVTKNHMLAKRGTIKVSDLAGVPMIMFKEGYDLRSTTIGVFETAKKAITIGLDGAEIGSVHAYVEAGLGAAIVPAVIAAAHPRLVALRLEHPSVVRQIGLAQLEGHEPSRAANALAQDITEYLKDKHWPVGVN